MNNEFATGHEADIQTVGRFIKRYGLNLPDPETIRKYEASKQINKKKTEVTK